MPPYFILEDNPDNLEMLLRKAEGIKIVNQEILAYIKSRKGKKVITHYDYTLQAKPPHFHILSQKHTKNIDEILSSWKYRGNPLTKDHNAMNDFVDTHLEQYEDLVRLNDDYAILLAKYSRVLTDEDESRTAVEIVLRNMETLQIALGEIHQQVKDAANVIEHNEQINGVLECLSNNMMALKSNVPMLHYDVLGHSNEDKGNRLIKFDGVKVFKDKLAFSISGVKVMEPYTIDQNRFCAIVSYKKSKGSIKLWNQDKNRVADTLKGHTLPVLALVSYQHHGTQMLASGSQDKTIKLWDLTNKINVYSLEGHKGRVKSLIVYKKNGIPFLASGSKDGVIKLWNLDEKSNIATFKAHEKNVNALCVFYRDDEPYLASGSNDKTIKIWSLCDHQLKKTFRKTGKIFSLVVVNHPKKILASGNTTGKIMLWDLNDDVCIGTITAHEGEIGTMEAFQLNGHACVASACQNSEENSVKVWNVETKNLVTTLKHNSRVNAIRAFMSGDRPCLACGAKSVGIKFWMA